MSELPERAIVASQTRMHFLKIIIPSILLWFSVIEVGGEVAEGAANLFSEKDIDTNFIHSAILAFLIGIFQAYKTSERFAREDLDEWVAMQENEETKRIFSDEK